MSLVFLSHTKFLRRAIFGAGLCLLGSTIPTAASAVEYIWSGGTGGTWDTSATNWTGASGTPWDSTNGPTNIARLNVNNSEAVISGTVVAESIRFSGDDGIVHGPGVIGFGTTTSTIRLRADAGKIGVINADFLGTGIAAGDGNKIAKIFSGKIILTGNVTLSGSQTPTYTTFPNLNVNSGANLIAGFTVEGGGELEITGEFKAADPAQGGNRSNFTNEIGNSSANNTFRISGDFGTQVHGGGMTIGVGAANGNNSVYVTRPGNATIGTNSYRMTGNGAQLKVGVDSDNNYFEVSNGATLIVGTGGGTQTWVIGQNAGADNNSMVVSGSGTSVSRGVNNAVNVGEAGSGNSLTIENGATFVGGRVGVGTNGGDSNTWLTTGTNTYYRLNGGTNTFFEVGKTAGSTANSFKVGPGGRADIFGAYAGGRISGVGHVVSADNNFIEISGAGAQLNYLHSDLPMVIGGSGVSAASPTPGAGNATVSSGGDSNHLDLFNGGTLFMDNSGGSLGAPPANSNFTYGANPTVASALVLTGTNSSFNLGNGAAMATATVGKTPNVGDGVILNSTATMNVNNGRLVAGASNPTTLISGTGTVNLIGPAYFSTPATTAISSLISGSGDFHKEGTGTLALTNLANNYSGDTFVDGGILRIDGAFLDDGSILSLASGTLMDLNFATGSSNADTIKELWLGGVQQAAGTYGRVGSNAMFENDVFFNNAPHPIGTFGFGWLNVLEGPGGPVELVPEPSALALAALGLVGLGILTRRIRK